MFAVTTKRLEDLAWAYSVHHPQRRWIPFLPDAAIDHSKLHVTFLSAAAPPTATKTLQTLAAATERFRVCGREIYLHFPDGYGVTKLSNAAIEKKLAVSATTRNWKTVSTLLAMAR